MTEAEAGGRRGRRTGGNDRVDQQPGFVLHSYPWRETSLIIEAFTRDHGRMALVARGAKRPTSQLRGLLDPFCPLALSWSGRNEIKSLVRVEWLGGLAPLRGDGLLAAFYLNELLVRLMIRADAHEHLFAAYIGALRALAQDGADQQSILRGFELDLLRWVATEAPDTLSVQGTTLRAMAARDFRRGQAAAQSKSLLRQLIRYHLNGQPLNTRRILQDLRALETVDPA